MGYKEEKPFLLIAISFLEYKVLNSLIFLYFISHILFNSEEYYVQE